MLEQQQEPREVEYWNALTNELVTVTLTVRQTALLVEFGDAVARLVQVQLPRLTREGLPLRAAENAVSDELQHLIESGFHVDE